MDEDSRIPRARTPCTSAPQRCSPRQPTTDTTPFTVPTELTTVAAVTTVTTLRSSADLLDGDGKRWEEMGRDEDNLHFHHFHHFRNNLRACKSSWCFIQESICCKLHTKVDVNVIQGCAGLLGMYGGRTLGTCGFLGAIWIYLARTIRMTIGTNVILCWYYTTLG